MSIKLVETEIQRFLSSRVPEVICISGRWGVGKTFAWNRFVRDAKDARRIALPKYSYVSLFGVNSLDQLKYAIFENTVNSSSLDVQPSLDTLRSNTLAVANSLGRKSIVFFQQLPMIKNYVGNISPAWFLSVRDTIVCIDDLERVGQGLSLQDILGLASHLKELRGCKIALILNDEALEAKRQEFERFFEKVIDVFLKFSPSAEESARIAFREPTTTTKQITEDSVKLGIENIRVLKKIERTILKLTPLLSKFEPQILTQAIDTLVLLGWCVYEPDWAPSLDYVTKKNAASSLLEEKEKKSISDKEAAWNALLDSYRFTNMDQLDEVLLDGLKNGFFDETSVVQCATELDRQIKATSTDRSFLTAWEMYHDSFDNNQEEVLTAMFESCLAGMRNVSVGNLSSTVVVLKELGRREDAAVLIKEYVSLHGEELAEVDVAGLPFGFDVKDPDLLKELEQKRALYRDKRDPVEVMKTIEAGWSPKDITMLANLTVDDYYSIFKNTRGRELRVILSGCLQFDRISNASDEMKEIPKRAKEALKRIAAESELNALRVRRYGVQVEVASSKGAENPQ